jgi:hypothetical protein
VESIRKSLVRNIEGCSSASQSLKLARCIGLKSKVGLAGSVVEYGKPKPRNEVLSDTEELSRRK